MRIACVHQGYELYGSDRSFVESVAALRAAYPDAEIDVVLPRGGPIVSLIERSETRISFEPIWVLRRQAIWRLATAGLASLPAALWRAAQRLRASDLVYINTSVVADHILAARFFRDKALLHIHEIPEASALKILRAMVLWSDAEVVFNSQATRAAFALPENRRTHIVYNGIAGPPAFEPVTYDGARPLRILMLGRISRIKGQEVLLDAIAALPPHIRRRLQLRIVGSAFENAERERALAARIKDMQLDERVSLEPFAADASPLYRWADVVVVPSCRPESLGRVAIEAMAFGRPPIVSAIGGLTEVVEDGRSGWFVPPGDAAALADRLQMLIENPSAWRDFAAAGRARYQERFSSEAAAAALFAIVDAKLRRSSGRGSAGKPPPTTVDAP
ncbi:Mannosylfructose-phosphate synthase [Methylovirgula sp. HY1]|nr:glycosyltransferase family 4 protein [Methylovirgula sp. HY1]QXX76294.1 Mannosylfructose-phosphate synthase [Methylovirgula sp. HY1]